ncbi:alpha/beta hydrolase family protein [Shewanella fidelis]|uniref:alpha/beta hydrolase family protein n=1 Tax=Shewanella fidelis TaxID=173509 RepID=UPI00048D800C|nr:prolyl oligopeptidase family serine peptidase [Shewanella fidelis]
MSLLLSSTFLTFSLFTLSLYSADTTKIINHTQVTKEQDCFRDEFSDYDLWIEHTRQKFERAYDTETIVNKATSLFKAQHSREMFEIYQKQLECRTFIYDVDGVPVEGYVIKPKNVTQPLPVVIYNRGGNGNFGAVRFMSMFKTLFPLAEQGFVIFGSQYRGTLNENTKLRYGFQRAFSNQHKDEFGGKDIQDVTRLIDFIPSIIGADPKRIGLFGWSRGGMQNYLVLRQLDNVKVVVTVAGNTDLLSGLTLRPNMERVYKKRIPNYNKDKIGTLESRSAIKWVEKLPQDVSILLMHGSADKRVDVSQSIEFAKKLKLHGISHKLVIYEDDDHSLTKNRAQANKEVVTWFQKHL